MQENMSATVETNNANEANVATTETQTAPSVETSKGAKMSKKQRKAQRKATQSADKKTSKVRVRRYSTVAVKSKKHILVAVDKKGAESFATGRNVLSRAAKINAVLLSSGRPLAVREIQEKLDAIYGVNEVRAVANHMHKLLIKKLVTLTEGRYLLIKKGAPQSQAPVTESEESK